MALVGDLSWDEVERRLDGGTDALLPIGAAAKQHGLHMPMNTDARQAEWLAGEVDRALGMLVWPTLTYGHYPAFGEFPGSIGLTRETFIAMVREIVADILRHGARLVFVLDTGISTIVPTDEALAEFGGRARHLKIHDGPRYRKVASAATQAYGSHADELETSRLLALAPEMVNLAKAAATPSPTPFPGPLTRANAPSGSYGDPTQATVEFGRKLLAAMRQDVLEAIRLASPR